MAEYVEYICDIAIEDMYFQQYGELKQKLVRCKDCKHYDSGLCWNVPKNEPPRPKEETFFCADGKRKDGELDEHTDQHGRDIAQAGTRGED